MPHRRWGIALLLGFGVLVNYFDRVNLSVSQQALTDAFGMSAITFGYLSSFYNWPYAALQLPCGLLLDRYGVKRIGRISTIIWSAASFAAAIATRIEGLFAARFLLGIGEAPTFPANAKAVGYWFPQQERSLATAMFDSAAKFAPGVGVPLIGVFMLRFGWRWSFVATGIVSLFYFALFYLFYRNPSEDQKLSDAEREYIARGGAQPEDSVKAAKGAPLGYLLGQPKVWGLVLGFASYNYTFYLLLSWLPSYISSALHVDLLHSVLYAGVPWLFAGLIDVLIGGLLVDSLIQRGWNPVRVRQVVLIGGTALGLGNFWSDAECVANCGGVLDQRFDWGIVGGFTGWVVDSVADCAAGECGDAGWHFEFWESDGGDFGADCYGVCCASDAFVFLGVRGGGSVFGGGIGGYLFLLGRIEAIPEPG